jgi:hypothetical protein
MKAAKELWKEMSIREISTQATFAEIAYSHIDPKVADLNTALFSSIHSFLSHCTMISKMLSAASDSIQPEFIGEILNVPKNSLIHTRRFRNHLEHYDERLKKWISDFGPNISIGTYNVGPKSMLQIPNVVFVSHYDPNTHTFTFVNEDFDLEALFFEVIEIRQKADMWVKELAC